MLENAQNVSISIYVLQTTFLSKCLFLYAKQKENVLLAELQIKGMGGNVWYKPSWYHIFLSTAHVE